MTLQVDSRKRLTVSGKKRPLEQGGVQSQPSLSLASIETSCDAQLNAMRAQLAAGDKQLFAYLTDRRDKIAGQSQANFEACCEALAESDKLAADAKEKNKKHETAVAAAAQTVMDSIQVDDPLKELKTIKQGITKDLARLSSIRLQVK